MKRHGESPSSGRGAGRGPKTLGFDVTYTCNIRCRMCGVWKLGVGSDRPELTAEQIIDTVAAYRAMHAIEKVRFLGGEPLLRDDLPDIVAEISPVVTTEVVTNGVLITPDLARRLVAAGLHHLRVSIDGPEHVNDRMRGKGTFRRASQGIEHVQREKELKQRTLPRITVWSCMSRANRGYLREMHDFAKSKGARLGMHFLVDGEELNAGRGAETTPREKLRAIDPEDLSLTVKEKSQVRSEYFRILASDDGRGRGAALLLRLKSRLVGVYGWLGTVVYRDCSRAMNMAIVDPWGDLFPCEHLYDHKYGNVLRDGPESWYSEERIRLRRHIRDGSLPICRACSRHAVHHDLPDLVSASRRLFARLR